MVVTVGCVRHGFAAAAAAAAFAARPSPAAALAPLCAARTRTSFGVAPTCVWPGRGAVGRRLLSSTRVAADVQPAIGGGSDETAPTPRRALLYLPGHDGRKARKAAKLDVDCVCLDLEDAVALNRKEDARETVVELLKELDFGRSDVAVRINAVSSGLAVDDLQAVLSAPTLPKTIVVPKVDRPSEMEWLFETSDKILRQHPRAKDTKINLVTQVESGIGLLNLQSVCELDMVDLTASAFFKHEGVILGGDDYAAAIGATRSRSNMELLYARQQVVATVKAYGLQAIDIVNIHFNDLDALHFEAEEGAAWGFDGKQVIHPAQVPVVQKAFSPSESRLTWALSILDAFYENQLEGTGAFSHEGQMIDMPTVLQCENVFRLGVTAGMVPADRFDDAIAALNRKQAKQGADAGAEDH